MPSGKNYVRDYKQEAKTAEERGEQSAGPNSGNVKRKQARRAMLKAGMVKPGQDVDHKRPISKGGSNKRGNLKASAPGKNRSFPRNPDGSIKSKA